VSNNPQEEIMEETPYSIPESPDLPPPMPPGTKKSSKTWIIVLVVILVLCCLCTCAAGGTWLWNNGDAILEEIEFTTGMLLPLI